MERLVTAFDDTWVGPLLDAAVQRAFRSAIEIVDDELFDEIVASSRHGGAPVDGMFTGCYLPPRYCDTYDLMFLRGMQVCLHQVIDRLADVSWVGLACRGEEFALHALLEQVGIALELDPPSSEIAERIENAVLELTEVAFEDLDYQYAFDLATDGIDDPETFAGAALGVGPLHPSAWFRPFRDTNGVHPLVDEDQRSSDRS